MNKLILTALLSTAATLSALAESVKFTEETKAFSNPGQGWFSGNRDAHFRHNVIPYGGGYLRIGWADIEPEEGLYNWDIIDNMIAAYQEKGLPIYLRIMCASCHSAGYYTTPKWVFDKGVPSKDFDSGINCGGNAPKPIARVTPLFSDPLFIKLHAKFIKELAKRYDGNTAIGGIDIGSYGTWGEWHVGHLGIEPSPFDVRKQYADMYLKNFKKTPLFFMSDDAETLDYAIGTDKKIRVGIRRDGVGSEWHYQNWIGTGKYVAVERMADVWKDQPVVFEWFDNYKNMVRKNWPVEKAADWMLANHCSLLNDNIGIGEVDPKEYPHLEKLSKFMGARLVPVSAEVNLNDRALNVELKGKNIGVTRIYLPFRLEFFLEDKNGNTIAKFPSSEKPTKWLPGDWNTSASFNIPTEIPPDTYTLKAHIYDSKKSLRDFKFASTNLDKNGNLIISKIILK